jgi:hypothetical protein
MAMTTDDDPIMDTGAEDGFLQTIPPRRAGQSEDAAEVVQYLASGE